MMTRGEIDRHLALLGWDGSASEHQAAIAAALDALFARLAAQETALAAMDKVAALDEPWPLADVLSRLDEGALHLLHVHNCDAHGYELLDGARQRVPFLIARIEIAAVARAATRAT